MIFKFKKVKKEIGSINVDDDNEWTMLIKPQFKGDTDFVHFHKYWNVEETPATFDTDGHIVDQEVKKKPCMEISKGFVKDGQFVRVKAFTINSSEIEIIKKEYIKHLESHISKGFMKHSEIYLNGKPSKPIYRLHTQKEFLDLVDKFTSTESKDDDIVMTALKNLKTSLKSIKK